MKIKFLPTENIFDLPEEECQRILSEDRANFAIVNEDEIVKNTPKVEVKKPASTESSKTIEQLVVKEDESTVEKADENIPKKPLPDNKDELIVIAKSLNITGNLSNCKVETLKKKIESVQSE